MRILLLVLWSAITTLAVQSWIGNATIYRAELGPRIEAAHQALLTNVAPEALPWRASGMNSTNIRVVAVGLAEVIHQRTGQSIVQVYRMIDTVALFVGLFLLIPFLRLSVPTPYAILGALFFASLLPLTYQLFFFQPWDRLGLVSWIALLWLLKQDRVLPFAILLPFSVALKFDVILLPGLYLLFRWARDSGIDRRGLLVTAALFLVSFGTYFGLRWVRPGGFGGNTVAEQWAHNLTALQEMPFSYPPLLAFAVPLALALVAWRGLTPWAKAGLVFGLGLLAVFATRSNFEEYRAHIPAMLVILPAALESLAALNRRADPDPGPCQGGARSYEA